MVWSIFIYKLFTNICYLLQVGAFSDHNSYTVVSFPYLGLYLSSLSSCLLIISCCQKEVAVKVKF